MRNRKWIVFGALILLGAVVAAAMALYGNFSAKASAADLQEALNSLPSDCLFVFGINVQKFAASPMYEKLQERNGRLIGEDLVAFIDKTGIDPERDVSFLVGCGRTGTNMKWKGVAIAVGKFDRDKITAYVQSTLAPVKTTYGATDILLIQQNKTGIPNKGIAVLNEREIALGDEESLKAVLDVLQNGNPGILSNSTIGPLINGIDSNEMIWFAGDVAGAYAKVPFANPLGPNLLLVRQVVGTMGIGDSVVGTVTATARDEDSAMKLADVLRGFIAIGQLNAGKNPDLKTMLKGITVSQNSTRVYVALNFPSDILDKQMMNHKSQRQDPKP